MSLTYADCDPLVSQTDLDRIAEAVRAVVPLPDDTQFTAYRVPGEVFGPGSKGEAHLFVGSKHPDPFYREFTSEVPVILDHAALTLETWDEYAKVRKHFVWTREDKLLKAFLLMASRHREKLDQLRNTIN